MTNKEQYAAFCQRHPEMPVMMQPWWLEAVCAGSEWDVMLIKRSAIGNQRSEVRSQKSDVSGQQAEDEVVAVMPYMLRKRLWFKVIVMPQLTQFGGIWLSSEVQASPDMQERLSKLIAKRLQEMHIAFYCQNYHIGSPMPYWLGKRGFRLSEKAVSGQLSAVGDQQSAVSSLSAEEFYRFYASCMRQADKKPAFTRETLLVVERKARRLQQCELIGIQDDAGSCVAAAFLVWDRQSLYCIAAVSDQQSAVSGQQSAVSSQLLSYINAFAQSKHLIFDLSSTYYTVERKYRLIAYLLQRLFTR